MSEVMCVVASEMTRACPYCESESLERTEEDSVQVCGRCGRSSLCGETGSIPALKGIDPAIHGMTRTGRRSTRRAPGEGASWPAAGGASVVTILFYVGLSLFPGGRVSDLFTERGWVPYVITLVSAWALLLLGGRLLRLRQEARSLERDLVVAGSDGRIGPGDALTAIAGLQDRAVGLESSFLVARLDRALRHFESRRKVVEVVEYLSSESSADEGRVDASYALVRVFVWVVPTLGFIGTVIGIGAAVGGFSETLEAASSLAGMKESIGLVTGGLGVAFDTTLLALVMSILIMFPASAVQRVEENFLGEVEDYCADHLVSCLRDEPDAQIDEALLDGLAKRIVGAMQTARRDADE
jgi:biopolymer transport protein ExbB/TolQ